MPNNRLFLYSFVTLTLLGILHAVASFYTFYWTVWWFDIPMHMLGGLWIALLISSFWFRERASPLHTSRVRVLTLCVAILLMSLIWELFEVAIGVMGEPGYVLDTLSDFMNAFLGGMVGYYITLLTEAPELAVENA